MSQLTGKRIRQLRLEKNLSQEELGEAVGLRKAAIHKYESGLVVNIKQDTIEKLAEILQTTPQFLLGYSDEPAEDYTSLPNAVPFSGVKRVPLLGEIACGQPILWGKLGVCFIFHGGLTSGGCSSGGWAITF